MLDCSIATGSALKEEADLGINAFAFTAEDMHGVDWSMARHAFSICGYEMFGVEAIEIGDVMVTLWRKVADVFLFILICEFFCAL